ncbi:hypothetical protein OHA70_03875 [Kribbella sp. NBC_00382]|uniref:hypothetical protein n=1 Tax=Kribbella sp. NBC_00382 TaxID=2975967 RepID=UPI002E20DC08
MSIEPELDCGVEVRAEPDGAVVVGPPQVGAAGLVIIALSGGLLTVDPMAPHGPWQLRVSDPSQVTVVEAVYGAEVAAAVKAADSMSIRLPLVASPVRDALVSLAVLRWLGTRCPIALDRPLLIVEENVLAARLGDLLDENHTRTDALLDWAPAVLDWARLCHRTGAEFRRTDAVPALIEAALREIEARLTDPEALAEVRHEADLLQGRTTFEVPATDSGGAWAVIDELSPQGAPVMGNDDSLMRRGWGPVDWDRTSPTATSRTEDAVSWRIMARAGGDLMTVVVKAFPPAPHADVLVLPDALRPGPSDLQATLHSSDWPLPLAVVELTSRPENGALMGSLRLEPAVADRIRNSEGSVLSVEVEARGVPHFPRWGADARRAAAVRWATRGLCCLRLAPVAPPAARSALAMTGAEALAFAARRYTELPDGASAAAQCMALIPASAEDRQYWTPDDFEVGPDPSAVGGDPVGGAARATAAEIWYAAAAPLSVHPAAS